MLTSLAVVIGVVGVAGATLRILGWGRRQRVIRAIDPGHIQRCARGLSLRVLVQGPAGLPNMNPHRANRTRGDLVLTADRLVVPSSRGVLIDLRPGSPRLTAVRSPGPGRLVLEGRTLTPSGEAGHYRVETVVEDAPGWVAALARFVDSGDPPVPGPRRPETP